MRLRTLAQLREIIIKIEEAAARGTATWDRIKAAVAETDSTLIDPSEHGVSVIRNHGANSALTEKLWRIWDEDNGPSDARDLFEQFVQLSGLSRRPGK